jgi:hypothetical protein
MKNIFNNKSDATFKVKDNLMKINIKLSKDLERKMKNILKGKIEENLLFNYRK